MKKQFSVVLLGLVIVTASFVGCKKGENDPFLSFRSRKGRLAGEWKVTSMSGTRVDGSSGTTTTFTYDGTTYSETTGSNVSTMPLSQEMTFEKDGTYKTHSTYTLMSTTFNEDENGTWNFTGRIGDDKNKDHVVMRTLSSTSGTSTSTSTQTWEGDDAPSMVLYIDQLKNKEVIFKYNGKSTSGNPASTDTEEWTMTLEPK